MKIYLAAPLFNTMELERNERFDKILSEIGYETYLPQRDGGQFAAEIQTDHNADVVGNRIFERDVNAVSSCDILLFFFDGRVPDEGACFELGMAYALQKKCIGFSTDSRSFIDGHANLMLTYSLDKLFTSELELIDYLYGLNGLGEKHE